MRLTARSFVAAALAPLFVCASITFAQQGPPKFGEPFVTKDQVKYEVGKYGGRIVRDTLGEPKSFNPITAGETSTTDYTARIFQGLTDEDFWTGEIIPVLADSWEVAPDKVTWTFKLRKDVTFNDGTPMTADDVVFSLNDLIYDARRPEGKDARWPSSDRDALMFDGKPVKIEKVDQYTVKFVTPVPIAIFDRLASFPVLSKAKYEKMVADGSFGGAMASDARPDDIVGTGPWMLGSYTRGQNVTLKRNPKYWKKDANGQALPYLDELVFQITRDLNLFLLNFKQGITDTYALSSGKDVPELKPRMKQDNFTIYQLGPDHGTLFLVPNQNLDSAKKGAVADYKINWFRDQRFRQAIAHAIDTGSLIRNVYRNLGHAEVAPFTLAPGPFKVDGIEPYAYDVNKAKELLAQMGLKPRGDGVLVDDQGREVSFTLNTNAGNTIREAMCDFVRKDLEKIGMKVNVQYLEFNLLIDKLDVNHDFEMILMGLTGGREPHDGSNVWQSFGRTHMWWPDQKTPSTDWEKRINDLFFQGVQEFDKDKRKAIYAEWVKIVRDQQPMIYLPEVERAAAVRNRFGNVFPSAAPLRAVLQYEEHLYVK